MDEIKVICPFCGNEMTEVDGMWYCENCGTREIE